MYTYTTPTLPITIEDIDFSTVDFFRIALKTKSTQKIFVVPASDSSVDPQTNTIYLELTQEQTAELEEGMAKVQARFKLNNGKVGATSKATVSIEDVYDKVII